MKFYSSLKLLFFLLTCIYASSLSSQEITAKQLADKALSFSTQLLNDSALHYQRLAAEQYLVEGDTNFHYRFRLNAAFSLMNLNKLDVALKESQSVIDEGADKMDEINLASGYRLIGQVLNLKKDTEGAQRNYQNALDILIDNNSDKAIRVRSVISSDKGILHYYNSDYAQAERFWRGALNILSKISLEKNAQLFCEFSLNLNAALTIRGASNESINVLTAAAKAAQEYLPEPDNILGFIYNGLGSAYENLGGKIKAIEYKKKALSLLEGLKDGSNKVLIFYSLGGSYNFLHQYDLAYHYISAGIEMNKRISGENDLNTSLGYIYLGQLNINLKKFSEAESFFRKAMKIESGLSERLSSSWVTACSDLARTKAKQQELDSAIYYGKAAVDASLLQNKTGRITSGHLEGLGKYYLRKENLDSALYYFKESINAITREELSYKLENPFFATEPHAALSPLIYQALALERKYDITQNPKYLEAARIAIESAQQLSAEIKQQSNIIEDKLLTQESFAQVNKAGFRIAFKMNLKAQGVEHLNRAFQFSQENKSNLILNQIQENINLEASGLPIHLIQLHDDVKASISYYEQELFKSAQSTDSLIQVPKFTNLLFEIRAQQDSIQNIMAEQYPNFYQAKFGTHHSHIQEIQKQLKSNQLLLNYHIGDSSIYIIKLSRTTASLTRKPLESVKNYDVTELLSLIEKPNRSPTSFNSFLNISTKMYEALLPDTEVLNDFDHLIIIPDDYLYRIPFEILTPPEDKGLKAFKELNFLVKKLSVSYANSATLLSLQNQKLNNDSKLSVLAFAPSFDSSITKLSTTKDSIRNGLNDLIWTKEEVENISAHFETTLLADKEATELKLRQLGSQHSVIHIASHGLLNEQDPLYSKLVFSPFDIDSLNDGYLNTQEIYSMKIPAEMVVLSACNTGSGDIISGEGLLSLAHAFFYAGSKSLVMSLWTANDQSTATIMDRFYKHLANGENKSTALRNAKLEFLEEADELRAHPYYWGHMVVNGNNQPIVTKSQWWIYLILALGLIVFAAARKQRRKRTA